MQPRSRMVLAGIVVFAAVIRLATLDVQSYWFDEAITVKLLRDDLGGLIGAIPDSESTPPLYYVLAWFWSKVFGTGEAGLRAFSAVIGTATVPVAYLVAKRWAQSDRIALIAAGLVAVNPLLIWYSQEARAYALLVLLCAATLAVLPRALERGSKDRGPLVAWAVLSALAFATHYFALFLVVPEAIWVLRRRGREAAGALAGVGVAGLALLPLAVHQAAGDRASFIRDEPFGERVIALVKQALVGYDARGEVAATVIALAVAAVAVWLVVKRAEPHERVAARALAILAGVSVAIPFVLAIVALDYLLTRNVIMAVVPLVVIVAMGLGTVRAGRAGAAALGVLVAVSLAMYVGVSTDEKRQRENWRDVPHELRPQTAQRALVISPANGRDAIELYVPRVKRPLGDEVVEINEIDVIGMVAQGDRDEERPPEIGPIPGFGRFGTVRTPTYTLTIYRAPGLTPVKPSQLQVLKQGKTASVLLQEPPRP